MEQIQEYNNSIYYFQNNNLIEFNLQTKKRHLHYQNTNDQNIKYHVLSYNIMAFQIGGNFYLVNRQHLMNPCKPLCKHMDRSIILQTPDGDIYIAIEKTYKYHLYNIKGKMVKTMKVTSFWERYHFYRQFDVLNNGQIVTWDRFIYVFGLSNNLEMSKIRQIQCNIPGQTNCVIGSSRLVIIKDKYIINIHTGIEKTIIINGKYFDTNHNLMICLGYKIIVIYDANKFNIIAQINHHHEFIHYHKKFDILITESLQLFVITPKYKLKSANIGLNYFKDRAIFPNQLMEMITDNSLLFDFVPDEITFDVLYQQLLWVSNHN